METREQKFGRLLAIANVLGQRVFESDHQSIADKHLARYSKHPAKAFEKIHQELMQYAHKFGPDELALLGMFEEIFASMDESEFTNEPLRGRYLHAYYSQQHALNNIMTTSEAAERWGVKRNTLNVAFKDGRFDDQIKRGLVRESGSTRLISEQAMREVYGEPKKGSDGNE